MTGHGGLAPTGGGNEEEASAYLTTNQASQQNAFQHVFISKFENMGRMVRKSGGQAIARKGDFRQITLFSEAMSCNQAQLPCAGNGFGPTTGLQLFQ